MHFSQNIEWALPILFILIIIIEQFKRARAGSLLLAFPPPKQPDGYCPLVEL